jgi:cation diffusion facilitator family transporter
MDLSSPASFAVISIAAACITIVLKFSGYLITGSVGLLSDAIESLVNLIAAVTAFISLKVAERPADANHMYGHTKAEYFSSVIEGVCILLAAGGIAYTAIHRLLNPATLHDPVSGIVVSALASAVNLIVALYLLRAGRKFRSITLEADAHHLFTDVWTSVAVIVGIFAVMISGIRELDPVIGLLVSANIVFSGFRIIKQSVLGFMDTSISDGDTAQVKEILGEFCTEEISYHGLRTRQSASRRFVSFHVLVPGAWTVRRGHNLLEKIEKKLRDRFEKMTVTTHLEPREDPRSNRDITLDRK